VVNLHASFELESGAQIPETNQMFLISGRKKAVIPFYATMFSTFRFNPREFNALVTILPGDKVAVFRNEQFDKLNIGKLRMAQKHKFVLHTIVANISSSADFQKIIDSL